MTPPGPPLSVRVDALESEGAIRRLMAAYADAVDRGADGATIARFFTPEGIFEGLGQLAAVLGRHDGHHAIARRFDANRAHLTFSTHFFANESIEIDGDHATGSWIYLQPAVHDGQAVWVAGRWHNTFARVDREWKLARNSCEAIFIAPYATGWPAHQTAPRAATRADQLQPTPVGRRAVGPSARPARGARGARRAHKGRHAPATDRCEDRGPSVGFTRLAFDRPVADTGASVRDHRSHPDCYQGAGEMARAAPVT
jgi:hypothetical protein